jgi:hypothetical protein
MARKPPPAETRWKKGQSGNPNGRPKGPGLTAILTKHLELKSDSGKTYAELLIQRVIHKAIIEGDQECIDLIWNRCEGKLASSIDLGSGGKPIQKFTLTLGDGAEE